jgi:tetratricopeptide (TPR) repeat protein
MGLGAGNWRVIYPEYVTQREKNEMFSIAKQPIRAHQDFLQLGSEWGIHGLLALLTLIGMGFWLTVRTAAHYLRREQKDPDGAALYTYSAMAALAGIVATCGDALFSFPLALPAPTMLFCVLFGVIAAAEAYVSGREPLKLPQWTGSALLGSGVAGLIFLQGFGGYQGLHERWDIAEKGFTEGRSLQKRGRASEGLAAIRQAIAINPDDFQNHFIEALCLNSLGQTQDAIKSLQRSLALYPNLLNAWVNVAMFSLRAGDEKGMDAAIDKALALKPDELVALNTRANYWNSKGRHEDVLKLLGPQFTGYIAFRDSGRWPTDDSGQLQGAFKTMLNHAITAAKKLGKHDDHAKYLIAQEEIPIPNDGRKEEAKRTERRDRANDIGEALTAAGKHKEALAYAKLAAELAGSTHPELKRRYAVSAARNGDDKTCKHEGEVAIRLDGAEKTRLVDSLGGIDSPAAKSCKDYLATVVIR